VIGLSVLSAGFIVQSPSLDQCAYVNHVECIRIVTPSAAILACTVISD
jgi:hypothetical protein